MNRLRPTQCLPRGLCYANKLNIISIYIYTLSGGPKRYILARYTLYNIIGRYSTRRVPTTDVCGPRRSREQRIADYIYMGVKVQDK